MVRLTFLFYPVLLVIIASSAFSIGTVLASHLEYIYMGMDEQFQASTWNSIPENYLSANWALTPTMSANRWTAPDPTVVPVARTAIANWTSATLGVHQLSWIEDHTPDVANVTFESADCGEGYNANLRVLFPNGWYDDTLRGASYWKRGTICISSSRDWGNDTNKVAVFAHELGHAYGLNDRNDHGLLDGLLGRISCNSNEITIMDGYQLNKNVHCDGLYGPSKLDVSRVKEIFKNGTLSDFTATSYGDSGMFTWRDNAWGERYHEVVYMYKLDWAAHPGEWEVFATSTYSADTGSHKDIAPDPVTGERTVYVFKGTISLRTHWDRNPTAVLPDKSAYMACGRPFFQQFNTYGPQSCAEIIVDNSAHNAQIPTPRPTSTLVNLYDADLDGAISRDEVIQAIGDYLFEGLLIRDEVIAIINLYLFG